MPTPLDDSAELAVRRSGLLNGLMAFGWWGLVYPLLVIALNTLVQHMGHFDAGGATRLDWSLEFLAHRAIWVFVSCFLLLTCMGRWSEVAQLARSRHSTTLLTLTALLILGNWIGFVYGATTGRLSHASLGYYINPLLSVALGVLVLGERLRRVQLLALVLAILGVCWETARLGQLPWISLLVAGAFGFYGLFRKQIQAAAIPGLMMESCILLPLALGYVAWREIAGPTPVFGRDATVSVLLVLSGIGTAAPLIWFAKAAKSLPLSSVAFLQFIVPTGQLLTAVLLNGETLEPASLVSFAFIWLGVAAFLADIRLVTAAQKTPQPTGTLTEF